MQEACGCGCSSKKRLGVLDYFQLGQQRMRRGPLAIQGQNCSGPAGLSVQFSLNVEEETIRAVGFESSTCPTLMAYCEILCEEVEGQTLAQAAKIRPGELIALLPQIPRSKHDQAALAVLALHGAVAQAALSRC